MVLCILDNGQAVRHLQVLHMTENDAVVGWKSTVMITGYCTLSPISTHSRFANALSSTSCERPGQMSYYWRKIRRSLISFLAQRTNDWFSWTWLFMAWHLFIHNHGSTPIWAGHQCLWTYFPVSLQGQFRNKIKHGTMLLHYWNRTVMQYMAYSISIHHF